MKRRWMYDSAAAAAIALFLAATPASLYAQQDQTVAVAAGDLGGIVTSAKGPEAGVWVIAETSDLPTKFAKIVVTDDQGRYLIPDLPRANYRVWVRGYGLVDSPKVEASPGKTLDLIAVVAPNEAAAAEYYPGVFWYSLLEIPAKSEFPGTGTNGNGTPTDMRSQHAWIDTIKNGCEACHGLGTKGVRTLSPKLGEFKNSTEAWVRRLQSGQAMANMATTIARLGPDKGLKMYADWTDRIAEGELPFAQPPRPQGVERNVVITEWEWSTPTHYMHDAISTDKRNPTINAYGLIYGAPEESTDEVAVLDPVKNTASVLKHPYRDPNTPSTKDNILGLSIYWGDKPIWDSHTVVHNAIFDDRGYVWFTARIRPGADPAFCKQGSELESAQVAPQKESGRQLSVYDPRTGKFSLIDTCFSTHHLYFGHDADETLWTSAGGPQSGVVGWLDTKKYLETGDEQKSQGWTPIIVDTNGNGKRDDYVEANQPVDPAKDKRIMAAFYGVQPSPVDDSIWGHSLYLPFTKVEQPGYIMRLVPGPDPAKTALTEIYVPPDEAYGPRGIDLDSNGVVWTAFSSGHLASFDRRKCKGPLNGPDAATGKLCPEGWTLYPFPEPQFKDVTDPGSAEHAYYVWVDRYNTLGLGPNVPIAMTNGGEALTALVNGKFVVMRVPYPLGFFTKNADGRIDDPNGGWQGRGVWTTSGTRAVFHNEGGTQEQPRVFHFQVRPNPLAH